MKLARASIIILTAAVLSLLPILAEAAAPILVEGAMECETDLLIKELENPVEERIGGWRYVSGEIQGIPVVVSVTSMGMTNAAAATVLGIEHFHPRAVINQGTSGGHDPALHTFDIVLGGKTFDAGAWRSRAEQKGADGRDIDLTPTYYYDRRLREDKAEVELMPNPELLQAAVSEAGNYKAGKVIVGKMASSNNWNRQLDRIRFFHEKYGSSCEEMETHAAAHICRIYDVPFLGIRIISNTEIHGEAFNPATGAACQRYVLAVIKSYDENIGNRDIS